MTRKQLVLLRAKLAAMVTVLSADIQRLRDYGPTTRGASHAYAAALRLRAARHLINLAAHDIRNAAEDLAQ
jgi:hypothetical protein